MHERDPQQDDAGDQVRRGERPAADPVALAARRRRRAWSRPSSSRRGTRRSAAAGSSRRTASSVSRREDEQRQAEPEDDARDRDAGRRGRPGVIGRVPGSAMGAAGMPRSCAGTLTPPPSGRRARRARPEPGRGDRPAPARSRRAARRPRPAARRRGATSGTSASSSPVTGAARYSGRARRQSPSHSAQAYAAAPRRSQTPSSRPVSGAMSQGQMPLNPGGLDRAARAPRRAHPGARRAPRSRAGRALSGSSTGSRPPCAALLPDEHPRRRQHEHRVAAEPVGEVVPGVRLERRRG